MNLPNFVIIGSAKSGTTSLHYYLGQHPEISVSRTKEVNFFSDPELWKLGPEWYRRNFAGKGPLFGEASPKYTVFPHIPDVPQRMHSLLPQARLIYLLRDPVQRVVARYLHDWSMGKQSAALSQSLQNLEESRYVSGARYALQLDQYLAFYPMDQILLVSHHQLLTQREATLNRIFEFLGVTPTGSGQWQERVLNRTLEKRRLTKFGTTLDRLMRKLPLRQVSAALDHHSRRWLTYPFSEALPSNPLEISDRNRLEEFLRPDVQRLSQLTGERFPEWTWV